MPLISGLPWYSERKKTLPAASDGASFRHFTSFQNKKARRLPRSREALATSRLQVSSGILFIKFFSGLGV